MGTRQQNYQESDIGDGVTLLECIANPVGSEKVGTTHVYLYDKYRFTCANKAEATEMKNRAIFP